ncbi:hypothetical protein LLH23_19105, partial [bacterium]|nr:hypothetical protein [bacterium]
AVDAAGVIYVAEQGGHRVRRIALSSGDGTLPSHYLVTTLAGSGTAGFAEGNGTAAAFNGPRGVAVDADGNVYVADAGNYRVRVVRPTGQVTTVAGTGSGGATDGAGNVATFNGLYGVAALPDRGRGMALVVADMNARTLRQLRLREGAAIGSASNWIVQTLAGQNGAAGATDGSGDLARFHTPRLVAAASSGTLYVADNGNSSIRRVVPNEGFFPIGAPTGATGESVRLSNADAWMTNPSGSEYPSFPIRKYPSLQPDEASAPVTWAFVVPAGVTAFEFTVKVEGPTSVLAPPEAATGAGSPRVWVRHVAGNSAGFTDGPGTAARLGFICGLDELNGYLYAGDYDNCAVRRIDRDGNVSTLAGVPGMGSGYVNGTGNVAKFSRPGGIAAVSGADCPWPGDPRAVYLFVADDANHRVRILCTPPYGTAVGADWEPSADPAQWQVTTAAGSGAASNTNGRGDVAGFNYPGSLAAPTGRVVYVSEYAGNRVRMLQWTGGSPMDPTHWQVSLVAGDDSSGAGASGTTDAIGSAARFDTPFGLAVDGAGCVFVADMGNHRIRRITPDCNVTTLAGSTTGYADGVGAAAQFWEPRDVTVDSAGYLYVTDRSNRRIRRVSPAGVVTTVAGTGASSWTDGRGDTATFSQPNVLTITSSGDLYVVDNNMTLGGILRLVQRVFDIGMP